MTSDRPTELKLVFDEPVQRKKAPKHLADFGPAERKAFAKELGFQPFRAAQVATHYFQHLSNNSEEWTDIPSAERQVIADALTPKMIELVTTRTTDGGMTRKDLWNAMRAKNEIPLQSDSPSTQTWISVQK